MGKIIRCITSDGLVVAAGIDSTDICAEAERLHKTSAVVTAALGRLLTAASLMGNALKGDAQSITLRVSGLSVLLLQLPMKAAMSEVMSVMRW